LLVGSVIGCLFPHSTQRTRGIEAHTVHSLDPHFQTNVGNSHHSPPENRTSAQTQTLETNTRFQPRD
jgi:hypothetical protein